METSQFKGGMSGGTPPLFMLAGVESTWTEI